MPASFPCLQRRLQSAFVMSHTALFSHCKKDKIVVYRLILHDSKHSQVYYYKSLFADVIMEEMIMPSFLYTVYLAPK